MALTDAERLRQKLGESVPEGGTDADTLFSDAQIADFLATTTTMEEAAYEGWIAKAAELANLVTVQEGQSKLNMSDLHQAALKQVEAFGVMAGVGAKSRSIRIGRLTRR